MTENQQRRRELIERVYDRDQALWCDVRHLVKPRHILRRMEALDEQLRATPPKKQAHTCRRYRALQREYMLLEAKLVTLTFSGGADEDLLKIRAVIEKSNLEAACPLSPERDAKHRRTQTTMLLWLIYRKYDNLQLERLLAVNK